MVAEDRLEYLVVREPLPAGTAVVEQTVRGGFERYDLLPGEIVFYVGNRRSHETISFDVVGATAGDYPGVYSMVVTAGLLALIINLIIRVIERRVLAWHQSVRGEVLV